MAFIWDYDVETLKKTESGRRLILERQINYGPGKGKKIRLSGVKKQWSKLNLFRLQKRLLELLIWGRYRFSAKSNKSFWVK